MARYVINGREWVVLVLKKLGINPDRVQRVVIDCDIQEPIKFYITYLGGEELLDVRPPEANEVQIVEK